MLLSRKLIVAGRGLAVAMTIGLMSPSALSEEVSAEAVEAAKAAGNASPTSAEQIEADIQAYIEDVNRRIAEDLVKRLKADELERIVLASAELATHG